MKTILKLTAFLLVLAGSFSSCKEKNIDEVEVDYSNIENLYAQPLHVIERCVQGKWKMIGTHGGLAGWTPAPDSSFVEIVNNKLNGREFQWVKHTKQNWDWETPFDTYAIQYTELNEPSLYFHSIKNDSLNVGYAPNRSVYDDFTGELWVKSR